ncbi:Maf family protein [Agarivorans sp. QJM3NY_29]|uniref:Maf family protein n=1 Tax=unclassified Agarivorans TaxID=2636026 RepID=UPI003D7ED69A
MENNVKQAYPLILASASPRRIELLTQLGWAFSVQAADIDEAVLANETPEQLVRRLAEQKAALIYRQQTDANSAVLGSDTIVVCQGQILGKPKDQADSQRMLQLLSAKQHRVMTAVCLYYQDQPHTELVTTQVKCCAISMQQMSDYWASGEPCDKAGSYAIQGIGGKFVEAIEGSYSSVVGLPLVETDRLLHCYLTC